MIALMTIAAGNVYIWRKTHLYQTLTSNATQQQKEKYQSKHANEDTKGSLPSVEGCLLEAAKVQMGQEEVGIMRSTVKDFAQLKYNALDC